MRISLFRELGIPYAWISIIRLLYITASLDVVKEKKLGTKEKK